MIYCGVLFIHWIRFLICHASSVWQWYSEGLHQLETWHLSNLTLPVHHLSTNLAPILYSHATFTLLVNHTWPWPACSHLGPLAVPIHHGSAVLFHRSMQRTHPVLLTWDTSMSFNPQSQTPNNCRSPTLPPSVQLRLAQFLFW